MFSITIDKWQDNGVEVIISDDIKWLNERDIQKQLDHSNLTMITTKYPKYLRKERQELQNCKEYRPCRKFLREYFAIQTIMGCRATAAVGFRTRLGSKQYDSIMTQEQSVLTKLDTYLKQKTNYFNTVF